MDENKNLKLEGYPYIDIDKVVPYINNARTHSKEQVQMLRSSLRKYGFLNPIIVNENYGLIAGHGRLEAAKLEGYKEVPYIMVKH